MNRFSFIPAKTIITATAIVLSFTFHAAAQTEATKTTLIAQLQLTSNDANCVEKTEVYRINDNDVKLLKAFEPQNVANRETATYLLNQALVNEVLVTYMKRGYTLESMFNIPLDNGCGVKRVITLRDQNKLMESEMNTACTAAR